MKIKDVFSLNRKVFIGYITLGFPSLKENFDIICALQEAGVNILELGIPFSDPLADGPIIQESSEISLKRGLQVKDVFKFASKIKKVIDIPLVILTYYNIVFNIGEENFIKLCKNSGIEGVIIPDILIEESKHLLGLASKYKISPIFLASPTSSLERIKMLDRYTQGFLYYVSLTGTTGPRKKLPPDLVSRLKEIKKVIRNPLCVGFGVSSPHQVREIYKYADGVIVGSKIVDFIKKHHKQDDFLEKLKKFIRWLKNV